MQASSQADASRRFDAEFARELVRRSEADSANFARKPVGVFADYGNGIRAVTPVNADCSRCSETMRMKE